jgi:hypothetical protein
MRHSNARQGGSMHGVLVELLGWLQAQAYQFVTVTPETHRRVLSRRPGATADDLRDIFGWSLPFRRNALPAGLLNELESHGLVEPDPLGLKSRLRASRVCGRLLLHSAYPTDTNDAVFLGPDSYRFARVILAELEAEPGTGRLLDIGAGCGVGAILAAERGAFDRIVLTDVNPAALSLAHANAAFAGVEVETVLTGKACTAPGPFDLILANPPFIDDPAKLAYRHGGELGIEAALTWTEQAIAQLAPGGRFLLYSGSAILSGEDRLKSALERLCRSSACALAYGEIDADIFGEQLDEPAYAKVERIAAIGALVRKS